MPAGLRAVARVTRLRRYVAMHAKNLYFVGRLEAVGTQDTVSAGLRVRHTTSTRVPRVRHTHT